MLDKVLELKDEMFGVDVNLSIKKSSYGSQQEKPSFATYGGATATVGALTALLSLLYCVKKKNGVTESEDEDYRRAWAVNFKHQ